MQSACLLSQVLDHIIAIKVINQTYAVRIVDMDPIADSAGVQSVLTLDSIARITDRIAMEWYIAGAV